LSLPLSLVLVLLSLLSGLLIIVVIAIVVCVGLSLISKTTSMPFFKRVNITFVTLMVVALVIGGLGIGIGCKHSSQRKYLQ
jgi:uncharacterized membrane protein YGL010W